MDASEKVELTEDGEGSSSRLDEAASGASTVDISCFTYTSCYCEENIYLLCKKLGQIGLADPKGLDLFVAFISNDIRQVPIWSQKSSRSSDGLVLWDYHVICIQRKLGYHYHHVVWDLDSSLPFPLSLEEYVSEAIRPSIPLFSAYKRLFRVIHGSLFLQFFASDRNHMRDSLGNWRSPPPAYKSIVSEDGIVNNLNEYIQINAADVMTDWNVITDQVFSNKLGVVVDETQFEDLFSRIHS